jgi:hypothetical protein
MNSRVRLIVVSNSLSVLTARKSLDAASRSITAPKTTYHSGDCIERVLSFGVLDDPVVLSYVRCETCRYFEFTPLVEEHDPCPGMRGYYPAKPIRQDLPSLDNQIVVIFKGVIDKVLNARPVCLRLTQVKVHGLLRGIFLEERIVAVVRSCRATRSGSLTA